MTYTAAIIGTGKNPEKPTSSGYAMGHHHADAYEVIDAVDLVACADIVPENARAFAEKYDLTDENVFVDYREMLTSIEPDVVSLTVPPAAHAEIAIDCIRAGVRAVHCEKPMALTWGGSRTMAEEAQRHDSSLTFNHQRRFSKPVRKAKELLDAGEIGELQRLETSGFNLYDYGSHSFDLCNYFNDETSAEWAIGQIDYRDESIIFGAHNENQALVQWEYENGVHGLAATGDSSSMIGCHNRLVGTEGSIEVAPADAPDGVYLRIQRNGKDWESIDTGGEGIHDMGFIIRAIEDVVGAIDAREQSELCAQNALTATEIIFGAWESARRRGRVDFPLEVDDNPLQSMVDSGALDPAPSDD